MDDNIKTQIIEFLKSFTRIVVQANLYSAAHPQVKSSASDFISNLNTLCDRMKTQKIVLSTFENKLMINDIPTISQDKIPHSILSLFQRIGVDSIEFDKEIKFEEIVSFSKIISVKNISPELYLNQNNINGIRIFKSNYFKANSNIKIQKDESLPNIENKNFVESIKEIVSRLQLNESKQKEIVELLLKKFKEEVEQAIERAINEIRKEKLQIENDYIRAESVITSIAGSEIIIDKNGNVIMTTPDVKFITGKDLKDISGKKLSDVLSKENSVVSLSNTVGEINDRKIKPDVKFEGDSNIAEVVKKATAVVKNEEGKIVGTVTVPHDLVKLKEIDQLKSDFISMITHELRSPLTSIKMALDLISKEKNLDPSSKNIINAAVRNAEKLNSIISDILDFSKLQSGKMVFNLEAVSPQTIINGAISSMKAWAMSKNLNLSSNSEPTLPDIYVDRRKTEQILINLISNAIKFTPEGGSIEVGAMNDGQYVKFYVKDTGCGIKKEDLNKIFEKFVQAVSGEKVGGTGLGLAITKAMVVMQGGSIDVESEIGKGSVFYVRLPIHKTKEKEEIPDAINEKKLPWWKKILGLRS